MNKELSSTERIQANTPVEVKKGDTICFGICQNEWVVGKSTLNTVVTCFTQSQKIDLSTVFEKLHVKMQDAFTSSTTHLTIDVLSVTVKVLHAIMENIPIVSTKFWLQFFENLKTCKFLPNPEDFKPRIDNDFLKTINYEADRKKIFAGKMFVFLNKAQKENYVKLIELGGGKAKELTKTMSKSVLVRESVICVHYNPSSNSQTCSQTTNDVFGK